MSSRLLTLWILLAGVSVFAQSPPASPDRPWHSPGSGARNVERQIANEASHLSRPPLPIDSNRVYSLAELIDLAEAHNPETRVAWESARTQAAALGIARSELYPTLAAVALSGIDRSEVPFGSQFYRLTVPVFQASLDLNYTVFDFGARRGPSKRRAHGSLPGTSPLTTYTEGSSIRFSRPTIAC